MKLLAINEEDFPLIYEEMSKAFISDEIRSFDDTYILLELEAFNIYHIVDNDKRVGFISLWDLGSCFYVEHFVVYEKYRNQGYGGKAIDAVTNTLKNVILEADLPNTSIAKRRLGFYKRHGFVVNPIDYIQPSYGKGKKPVQMHLLSYPNLLENPYEVVSNLHKIVYSVE